MARILILTPQLPVPPQALTGTSQGTTIRNYHLIAGLARRHTVDLVSFVAPDDPAMGVGGEPSAAVGILRALCSRIILAPQPVRGLASRAGDTLFRLQPDMALRLASPFMRQKLGELMQEAAAAYDVIQIEGLEMAPYIINPGLALYGALLRQGRPLIVFDDHNAEYVLQQRAFQTDLRRPPRWIAAAYSFVQWRKLIAYERKVCRAADRVVAVSEADREALQRLVPGLQVAVVPNGVDLEFLRPGIVPPLPGLRQPALVFTGKMDYRPNVDAVLWFVEAVLPLIRAEVPSAHFYVVGQQPHPRLAPLAHHPAVTLTGRVPDVRPYIAGAGVYVVPLRIGGGTRLKVLEAMAMGQAIVSTRLGCDGFPFQDGREVIFADEPAAFAASVIRLLRQPQIAAELGQRARAYVAAHFGWDAILPRLEAVYG
ncbi:MAG: glycosyltransferase [Anaerolineae bacterium]